MSMIEMLPAVLVVAVIYYGLKWFLGTSASIYLYSFSPSLVARAHPCV